MKRLIILFACILLALPAVALANHHAIKIADQYGGGSYLTDAEGKTLYWFTRDSAGMSACTGGCVDKWPLYFRETVAPPAGIDAGDFSTITRADGKKQTTFRGYPLYYWFKDGMAGEMSGDGVGGVWFVIDPKNFPPN